MILKLIINYEFAIIAREQIEFHVIKTWQLRELLIQVRKYWRAMIKYVKFEIPTNLKNLNLKIIFKTKAKGDSE